MIAGDYSDASDENINCEKQLHHLAKELKIENSVVFLRWISEKQKVLLLKHTDILLWTQENFSFGLLVVEAMYFGCLVIACNSGGPLESVDHETTGYLLPPNPKVWSDHIGELMLCSRKSAKTGKKSPRSQDTCKSVFTNNKQRVQSTGLHFTDILNEQNNEKEIIH